MRKPIALLDVIGRTDTFWCQSPQLPPPQAALDLAFSKLYLRQLINTWRNFAHETKKKAVLQKTS
jgi:hypothetical protein